MRTYEKELDAARRIAARSGELALGHFGGVAFEAKPDASPVTVADRESEALIAAALVEAFPEDGLLGEEGARRESRSGRRWIIDPIDGTRDFIRGNPTWAVLLGLEDQGRVVLGVAYMPAMGQTFWATAGGGSFRNGEAIHASATDTPSLAVLSVDSLTDVGRYPFAAGLVQWMSSFWAVRAMGGCMDALMVARGQSDLWLCTGGKPWDFAALKVIAEEAGARYFDFAGGDGIASGNAVICAPGLETEARGLLALR